MITITILKKIYNVYNIIYYIVLNYLFILLLQKYNSISVTGFSFLNKLGVYLLIFLILIIYLVLNYLNITISVLFDFDYEIMAYCILCMILT